MLQAETQRCACAPDASARTGAFVSARMCNSARVSAHVRTARTIALACTNMVCTFRLLIDAIKMSLEGTRGFVFLLLCSCQSPRVSCPSTFSMLCPACRVTLLRTRPSEPHPLPRAHIVLLRRTALLASCAGSRIVRDTFGGWMVDRLQCPECGFARTREEVSVRRGAPTLLFELCLCVSVWLVVNCCCAHCFPSGPLT